MKNNIKLYFISFVIAAGLMLPLQLPTFADSQAQLNDNIKAMTKEPISKKKIATKFIMAMLGVAASSIILYVSLSAYNRFFRGESSAAVGLNSLRTPENFKDAIEVFIEKTDWD
ncbi:MAG: hypothetical protein ACI4S3_04015 [Candidatus Gastranaerophilaceae bacterium]